MFHKRQPTETLVLRKINKAGGAGKVHSLLLKGWLMNEMKAEELFCKEFFAKKTDR